MTDTATATNPISDPALRELAVATDTRLAELDGAYAKLRNSRDHAISAARSLLGHRGRWVTRSRQEWPTTGEEAIELLRERVTDATLDSWNAESAQRTLAGYDTAELQMAANRAAHTDLDAVWAANGCWSRFFLVTSSNGHIHYDVSGWRCSRQPSTAHGWNPELSGLTEAEAVAALGPLLCSTCFPSAPVEWTLGKPKPATCAGSRKPAVAGSRYRRGMHEYGTCTGCETTQIVTMSGIRAHKPPKK